ncbi:unnamed protein product [Sphenostylis stenocarpa]|uniref:RNA helicase n=1 Tax=Sphenostylis stenocarpa TaxID=92480 RepID=A0AA86SB40_9FABA|nr:unnamed protein product [Sphenostylis stenocarpa]
MVGNSINCIPELRQHTNCCGMVNHIAEPSFWHEMLQKFSVLLSSSLACFGGSCIVSWGGKEHEKVQSNKKHKLSKTQKRKKKKFEDETKKEKRRRAVQLLKEGLEVSYDGLSKKPQMDEIHLAQADEVEENDIQIQPIRSVEVLNTTSMPLESSLHRNEVDNYKYVSENLADISIVKQHVEDKRKDLPIVMMEQEIMEALNGSSTVIICGEIGCGKTTQVPQFLYEAGYGSSKGIIGVTQPRRVAVLATAKRVAYELGLHLGKEAGFQVRYDNKIALSLSNPFVMQYEDVSSRDSE